MLAKEDWDKPCELLYSTVYTKGKG
jgi:hypothetical protein